MKLLLLGANGQVGHELAKRLPSLGELACATRGGRLDDGRECASADLAQTASLNDLLQQQSPDIVINAAAYTAVDKAESQPELADRINHLALATIGDWASRHDRLVVHYSTDYVFDGSGKRPYREDDATAPLGVYGRTKLAGEAALRDSGCAHLILRTAWVYAARGRNFLRTMLGLAGARDSLRVVDDQRGAPTTAALIAASTASALSRWIEANADTRGDLAGIHHLCASGECSWHEFAQAIFARALPAGLIARAPQVAAIPTSEYPTPAKRPAYSVLDTAKIRRTFGLDLPAWQVGLEAVMAELTMQTKADNHD